jgi:hypothetical protein
LIRGRNLSEPIKLRFKTDSLKNEVDICSTISNAVSEEKAQVLSITFFLVSNNKERGRMFSFILKPSKRIIVGDSIILLNEIRL